MAEIRKHQPKTDHAIDQALLKALGEQPRPVTPGEPAKKSTTSAAQPSKAATSLPLSGAAWVVPVTPKPSKDEDVD